MGEGMSEHTRGLIEGDEGEIVGHSSARKGMVLPNPQILVTIQLRKTYVADVACSKAQRNAEYATRSRLSYVYTEATNKGFNLILKVSWED